MKRNEQKVMMTGGAGFISSNLASRLVKERAEFLVLDDFSARSIDQSFSESFGMSNIETFACGTPVIGKKAEVIQNARSTWLL